MILCCVFPENIHTSPTEGNLSKIPPCTPLEIPIPSLGENGYFLELHFLTLIVQLFEKDCPTNP